MVTDHLVFVVPSRQHKFVLDQLVGTVFLEHHVILYQLSIPFGAKQRSVAHDGVTSNCHRWIGGLVTGVIAIDRIDKVVVAINQGYVWGLCPVLIKDDAARGTTFL